jgi:ubiquinone/menaquinone biosynthesis C-methylase UbiE
MEESSIFTIFEGLPRQGPGSDACTSRALGLIPGNPLDILDIGCGSGKSTLVLARLSPHSKITAVDIYQPFLDDLSERAKKEKLDAGITTVRASMDDLPFPDSAFDLIWSEGAAYIMGFKEALLSWKKFLKPGGYMAVSECVWFTETPSNESLAFFNEIYPAIMHEQKVKALIEELGYEVLGVFRLPDNAWLDEYYNPLSRKLKILRQKYKDDAEVQVILDSMDNEMKIFRSHSREYGYSFFIMRKKEDGYP